MPRKKKEEAQAAPATGEANAEPEAKPEKAEKGTEAAMKEEVAQKRTEKLPTEEEKAAAALAEVPKKPISPERLEAQMHSVFKQVESVVFGLLSPKMIKKMASAKIVTPELYDKEGYPVDGGLMDVRLGVIDPGLRCKTCGSKLKECIGHFGYIELARPVVHVKFARIIQTLLKCTCKECGRILIPQEKITRYNALLNQVEQDEGIEARRTKIKD
ncbi:MAG: hypothetical protein QXM31_04150, partial [Candidatus Woesearchaeota archaeon]